MRENIAITGATGYVGRNVRRVLARMGVSTVCITRKAFRPRDSETVLDSYDSGKSVQALRTCNAMIHLAGVGRHVGGMGYSQNVTLAQSAVSACKKAKIPRLVFVSGLGADTGSSAYFSSKLAAEQVISDSGLHHTILRASYIVGRNDALSLKIKNLASKRHAIVPGTGRYIIQPVYIDDACDILVKSATSHTRTSHILDLVGSERISYRKFVSLVTHTRAVRGINLESALQAAATDPNATYDIDELEILLGSFGGDYDTLYKTYGIKCRSIRDVTL